MRVVNLGNPIVESGLESWAEGYIGKWIAVVWQELGRRCCLVIYELDN